MRANQFLEDLSMDSRQISYKRPTGIAHSANNPDPLARTIQRSSTGSLVKLDKPPHQNFIREINSQNQYMRNRNKNVYKNQKEFWCGGKPYWLRHNLSYSNDFYETKKVLQQFRLNTVCEEAACPNKGECWSRNEATFIILGKNCSRNCLFCNVENKLPEPLDTEEPQKIGQAVKGLQLKYITVTSVTRDDLSDFGTDHFIKTVREIKSLCPSTIVEILIPDMDGDKGMINKLALSGADVVGHNIETVERLYPIVRQRADYKRSLKVLKILKENSDILTKSAIMIGLGETWQEIELTLKDLFDAGMDIVHIGQYLKPSTRHSQVYRYYTPEEFKKIENIAIDTGFKAVKSGPFMRSSYKAYESYIEAKESYASCNVL